MYRESRIFLAMLMGTSSFFRYVSGNLERSKWACFHPGLQGRLEGKFYLILPSWTSIKIKRRNDNSCVKEKYQGVFISALL